MHILPSIIWTFPILFIIHDFEEIILMKPWIIKNSLYFQENYPRLAKRLLPHFNNLSTESFALGVAEEFIIIVFITLYTYFTNDFKLWLGLFAAFIFHLVIHLIQSIIIKSYIPAVVTSILCLPFSIYAIMLIISNLKINYISLIAYSIVGIIAMIANLVAIHRVMEKFDKWLRIYQDNRWFAYFHFISNIKHSATLR